MKKIIVAISALLFIVSTSFGQKVSGKLKFEQGKVYSVNLQLKTSIAQEAMGQSIDFTVDGAATHEYTVTNSTEDNSTLHHTAKELSFNFDGMGQKRSFDSNKEKDLSGPFGKPIKELLSKTFDIIINPNGKVLIVQPEKIDSVKMDDRMAIITNMLKDLLDIVQPPKKGSNSFFKVLPENEVGKGDTWNESRQDQTGLYNTTYTVAEINDSTVAVDVAGTSITINKAQMMGSETTTKMNNKTTGKIIVDKATGIIREKNLVTESNGSTDFGGNTLPLTSKTTVTIKVN